MTKGTSRFYGFKGGLVLALHWSLLFSSASKDLEGVIEIPVLPRDEEQHKRKQQIQYGHQRTEKNLLPHVGILMTQDPIIVGFHWPDPHDGVHAAGKAQYAESRTDSVKELSRWNKENIPRASVFHDNLIQKDQGEAKQAAHGKVACVE